MKQQTIEHVLETLSTVCFEYPFFGAQATPTYMAPELFRPGGVHSSASDLWALGCVLHECAAGRPPFLSPSFARLAHLVLHAEPSPLPAGAPTPCACARGPCLRCTSLPTKS